MQIQRISELDGLRAIAVLMVIVWHYFGIPDGENYWLWKTLDVGRFGVDLFFVLSGYLITTILLNNRDSNSYYSSFYGRRALRIWPLYYAMCAINFVGWLFHVSPNLFDTQGVHGWMYAIGIQNFGMANAESFGSYWLAGTWSLAIEEQFYLVFPMLVRFIPTDRLGAVLLAPIIICPIGRLIDSPLHDVYGWYVLPRFRIDSLAIGALIAWIQIFRQNDQIILGQAKMWLKRSFVLVPLLWVFGWGRWGVAFSHTIAEIFFGSILFYILQNRGSIKLKLLRSDICAFFAKISYAAYLTHHVIGYMVFAASHQARTVKNPTGIALTIVAFGITCGVCYLSHIYFEEPLIKFGHNRFQLQEGGRYRSTSLALEQQS